MNFYRDHLAKSIPLIFKNELNEWGLFKDYQSSKNEAEFMKNVFGS